MSYFRKNNQDISLEDCEVEFEKLNRQIKNLLYKLGDDCDNLRADRDDLDQEFLRDQYRTLANKLESVYSRLEYLAKPIVEQGYIRHNESGRYELPGGTYFTSGSVCEILYTDKKYDEQSWVYTSIEHNGKDYYATSLGRDTSINGMMVRVRGN